MPVNGGNGAASTRIIIAGCCIATPTRTTSHVVFSAKSVHFFVSVDASRCARLAHKGSLVIVKNYGIIPDNN